MWSRDLWSRNCVSTRDCLLKQKALAAAAVRAWEGSRPQQLQKFGLKSHIKFKKKKAGCCSLNLELLYYIEAKRAS